jgi:hypothetical protein
MRPYETGYEYPTQYFKAALTQHSHQAPRSSRIKTALTWKSVAVAQANH